MKQKNQQPNVAKNYTTYFSHSKSPWYPRDAIKNDEERKLTYNTKAEFFFLVSVLRIKAYEVLTTKVTLTIV